jgi:high-affinity nickel permease
MFVKQALAIGGSLIVVLVSTTLIMASAHPNSGLTSEWRMWYCIGGIVGTVLSTAVFTINMAVRMYEERLAMLKQIYEDEL